MLHHSPCVPSMLRLALCLYLEQRFHHGADTGLGPASLAGPTTSKTLEQHPAATSASLPTSATTTTSERFHCWLSSCGTLGRSEPGCILKAGRSFPPVLNELLAVPECPLAPLYMGALSCPSSPARPLLALWPTHHCRRHCLQLHWRRLGCTNADGQLLPECRWQEQVWLVGALRSPLVAGMLAHSPARINSQHDALPGSRPTSSTRLSSASHHLSAGSPPPAQAPGLSSARCPSSC
jgi:hypothetical protein